MYQGLLNLEPIHLIEHILHTGQRLVGCRLGLHHHVGKLLGGIGDLLHILGDLGGGCGLLLCSRCDLGNARIHIVHLIDNAVQNGTYILGLLRKLTDVIKACGHGSIGNACILLDLQHHLGDLLCRG